MNILDYLDAATHAITPRHEAKNVRDELYDHYVRGVEARLAEGLPFDKAQAQALAALGPVELLQARMASPPHPVRNGVAIGLWITAWVAALLSFLQPVVFPVVVVLSIAGIIVKPNKRIRAGLRHHRLLIALAIGDGLVVGTYPLWAAGPYSYWSRVATSEWTTVAVFLLMLGTPIYVIWRMTRNPAEAFTNAGIGSGVFALATGLFTVGFWRLYPVGPSPNVDWYTTTGVSVPPDPAWTSMTMLTHPLWFTLIWYLGSVVSAAIVRAVRTQPIVDSEPPMIME
ncbi:hypothetical protein [Sulfobacillus harzensis]|uniref:Uncharacterized protein n=1 Tax=Sulfobacillus harzensis TaxID=2729629 RepID=A0A7Y0L4N9_9FIRM|nr:hypothetical protein [Sulfobacillus harzensis]NMP23155.1 hypothetical protein [Sulfobacillus harzensis]